MTKTRTAYWASLALLSALSWPGTAAAHHAFTDFDREKTVTLSGTVKSFDWTNPHVWIAVVTQAVGPDTEKRDDIWDIEGSSPNLLARGGWKPSTLKPGDTIFMRIHPRRDGKSGGYLADEAPIMVNGQKHGGLQTPWNSDPNTRNGISD